MPHSGTLGQPLPVQQRDQLRDHVRALGERRVLQITGVSRNALARALAGLGVRDATAFMIVERLRDYAANVRGAL